MIVKGQHKVVNYTNVEIEVEPKELLHKIHWQAQKHKPAKASHIANGKWYVENGFDYHKREELTKEDRPLTSEELEIFEAFEVLKKAIK